MTNTKTITTELLTLVVLVVLTMTPSKSQAALLDCGFDDQGKFVVHSVDYTEKETNRVVKSGDECVPA